MACILMFDDDESFLKICAIYLREKGHQFHASSAPEQAVELARRLKPDLVITDLMMPGTMGGGVYEALRQEFGPALPVVVCSAMHLKLHANDPRLSYCPKPVDLDGLLKHIEKSIAPQAK